MPPFDSTSPTHLEPVYAERMSRVDGCPEACGNTETPTAVIGALNGFHAAYVCSDCGHSWTTNWKEA